MPPANLRPVGQLVYLWPGYDPAVALAWPGAAETQAQELTLSKTARLPLPTRQDLATITSWMEDNDVHMMSYTRCGQANHGPAGRRWHGRYRVLLGIPK